MKNLLIIVLLSFVASSHAIAQFGKNLKKSRISIAATLNYYPKIEPYSFSRTYQVTSEDLILTFLTANSGTFVIEENQSIAVTRDVNAEFPAQTLGFGMSFQIMNEKSFFQELSIAQFSIFKSEILYRYSTIVDEFPFTFRTSGGTQKTAIFGIRYEFGKYFGNRKSKIRFGLAGSLEPTLYSFKLDSKSVLEFPISAKITTIEVGLIPILSTKLGKNVFLDFKLLPNFLIADYEKVTYQDPAVAPNKRDGTRSYNLPEIDLGASLQLRAMIREVKKWRKR